MNQIMNYDIVIRTQDNNEIKYDSVLLSRISLKFKQDTSNIEDNLDIICPITQQIMKDPYVDSDGNSFEKAAIIRWLSKHQISPLTKHKMTIDNLAPNRTLKKLIDQLPELYNKNCTLYVLNKSYSLVWLEPHLAKTSKKMLEWFATNVTISINKELIRYTDIEYLYINNFAMFVELFDFSLNMNIKILYSMCIKRICYYGTKLYHINENGNHILQLIKVLYEYDSMYVSCNFMNIYKTIITNIITRGTHFGNYEGGKKKLIKDISKICGDEYMLDIVISVV